MLIKSKTTLRIIILSLVTIASSSTPMSDSRPQSRRYFGPATSMSRIGTNRRVKAMPLTIEAPPPIGRSARRIFFWPWNPRWYHHRWWHRRPFGFGAGIYGGVGIGIGSGAGLGFHRPIHFPGFGGSAGIGVGLGAGIGGGYKPGVGISAGAGAAIGAGYKPGVGISAGAGAAIGAGIVPSQPIYDQYQPETPSTISDNSNGAYSDPERHPVNYPDLPPVTNDFSKPPISSNGPDFSGPSAVGFDDSADHSVGYDRAVHKFGRYKNQGYLKQRDPDANYVIDRGSTQQNGSYMTNDDANKKRAFQWFRDRHKKVATGQSDYEDYQNYLIGRETNSYGRDFEGEQQGTYYDEDRYRDYPVAEQQFFTNRNLAHANDGV